MHEAFLTSKKSVLSCSPPMAAQTSRLTIFLSPEFDPVKLMLVMMMAMIIEG